MVRFEQAGHNACYEDAAAFDRLLIETVLPGRPSDEVADAELGGRPRT